MKIKKNENVLSNKDYAWPEAKNKESAEKVHRPFKSL